MPYLFAYLLYYVTKWPVNPVAAGTAAQGIRSAVPCLLHVYWAFHAIHLIGAGCALWRGWAGAKRAAISDKFSGLSVSARPAPVPLTPSPLSLITRLLPWLLLALIFYIPGVYLEWPSDPWEHLRRINEWHIDATVGAHSSWLKSSYFFTYSLVGQTSALTQLAWLDVYYTGICLLLCWQYYRLARACGMGDRASMVFVLLQALLFGNNVFSFYRYYGISSSIYAQLGAVALTRVVLEFASRGIKKKPAEIGSCITEGDELRHRGHRGLDSQDEVGRGITDQPGLGPNTLLQKNPKRTKESDPDILNQSSLTSLSSVKYSVFSLLASVASRLDSGRRCSSNLIPYRLSAFLSLITSVLCLTALTAFNHQQGIGIAALGIAAVLLWRLVEWKRSALRWLIAGTLLINVLFLWLYPRPAIIETYRAQGWLNAWYGFNLLHLSSPAGDRMMQIISAFGLINIAAALYLLRRNHVVAWLTLFPLLALLLPCISIPFATALSKHGDPINIITFQRMLFVFPQCIALVTLGAYILRQRDRGITTSPWLPPLVTCLTVGALVTLPFSGPSFQRTWHALAKTPQDQNLKTLWTALAQPSAPSASIMTVGTSPISMLQLAKDSGSVILNYSRGGLVASNELGPVINTLAANQPKQLPVLSPTTQTSAYSFAGLGSTHWLPQETALAFTGARELQAAAIKQNLRPLASTSNGVIIYLRGQ